MTTPEVPTRDELATWLTFRGHPADWADALVGLPMRYIEPVVTIAKNTRNHPSLALATAAAYSSDAAFKQAAGEHLRNHPAPPGAGPNRAQRRANARGRRPR